MNLPLPSKRVVLAGWYGAVNVGDELLLCTVAQWVRQGGGTPVALSGHPAYTRDVLGIEAVSFDDPVLTVEALAGADVFVLGGGGLLQDYDTLAAAEMARFPAAGATRYAQLFHLAVDLGLTTVALAQGVGPLRSDEARDVAKAVFDCADHLSVRDAESRALLHRVGVTRDIVVAPDPVWSTPLPMRQADLVSRYPALAGKKLLAINLRHWPFIAGWEDRIVDTFETALPSDWAGVWIDFQRPPRRDGRGFEGGEIASRIIVRVGGSATHVCFDAHDADDAAAALGACDATLAMRLHALILGHRAGMPVAAIEYDGKVTALNDSLDIPATQRMGVLEAPACLHRALARITTPGVVPYVVPPARRAELAAAALKHRDVLWAAMSQPVRDAPSPRLGHTPVFERLAAEYPANAESFSAAKHSRSSRGVTSV